MNDNNDSWCDMLDNDIVNIKHDHLLSDKINLQHKNTQHSIAEILKLDYFNMTEFELLKHQSYIILQLKKHALQCENMHNYLNELKWLETTSFHLANKKNLKLPNIPCEPQNKLKRSSYEFCNKGKKCLYYVTKKCKKQHFVYNKVKCDLYYLILYIENNECLNHNEIITSINTISYVINYMKDEFYN